jgi:glucose/arabinose dehydrogenase
VAALGALLAAAALGAPAADAHPFHPGADSPDTTGDGLRLVRIATLRYPVDLTAPRGDPSRQFVVEQDGVVRVIKNRQLLSRPFLNIRSSVGFDGSERGMFSIAFPPDYAETRRFYVLYNRPSGNVRVDELRRSTSNPDVALTSTRRRVLEIEHTTFANHNGGQLQFRGNLLYLSTGDGGGSGDPLENAQDTNSLLGKVLRIDPRRSGTRRYSIPSGNPFVGTPGRDEIWHYGLRNPWRMTFDRATGNMAIGDVGQNAYEEINFVSPNRRAANFGWDCFEGFHTFEGCSPPRYAPPVLEYSHAGGGSCSVVAGYVVRDPNVGQLLGRLIYGDYCTGAIHAALAEPGRRTPPERNRYLSLVIPRLTSFGEDARGRIYVTSRSMGSWQGGVFRLQAVP